MDHLKTHGWKGVLPLPRRTERHLRSAAHLPCAIELDLTTRLERLELGNTPWKPRAMVLGPASPALGASPTSTEPGIVDAHRRNVDVHRRFFAAQRTIVDAERAIFDVERRIFDAERTISDAERTISDAERTISDAVRTIFDAQRRFVDV
jgi:hypothetical protein